MMVSNDGASAPTISPAPLVPGNAGDENPSLRAINRLEGRRAIANAIRGVADIDHRQRLLLDDVRGGRASVYRASPDRIAASMSAAVLPILRAPARAGTV